MNRKELILQKLAEGMDLPGEAFPGQTIVEITEDHRVLIEDHRGVREYCGQKICVNVKYGQVAVCGNHLEIVRMTKELLVITGTLESVQLIRRKK